MRECIAFDLIISNIVLFFGRHHHPIRTHHFNKEQIYPFVEAYSERYSQNYLPLSKDIIISINTMRNMINHSIAHATALLALADLSTAAAIRTNNDKPHGGLRKLYYSEKGHEVTDVQTKCDQVIEGDPKQCMIVCIEVTSIKNGDELVDEHSRVSQRVCEAGWEHDGHRGDDEDWKGRHTEWPTYSPTLFPTYNPTGADAKWTGDGHESVVVVDWTDDGWTRSTDESLASGGSKGGKSGGHLEGSQGGYSKSSKSEGGYSKSSKSKSGNGGSQSKTSKSKGGKVESQS